MSSRKDRTQSLATRSRFRIDDLMVQPDRLVAIRDGEEIRLEPRMMEVLVMLAEHAGETLSTERLLIDVWHGTFYGDNPVNATISKLRARIGDDSRSPRYVQTVSKVGYRLIAPVALPEDYRRMPATADSWTQGSPYVGLSPFDATRAMVFCGRSRTVADLLGAMRSQIERQRRFVLIVGASGCGKTSLLRAGAIPLLTQPRGFDGLQALSVASCDLAAAHGGDVLTPLAAALSGWSIDGRPVLPPMSSARLAALLAEAPDTIPRFVEDAFRRRPHRDSDDRPGVHLLLAIDHAEALVAAADTDAGARSAFERVLRTLCGCPHVFTIMASRSDFYPKLIEALPTLAESKAGDGHLDVLGPRYGEIGEIIRTPAWKADLAFETDPVTRTRLDDALRDAALTQPDALPLLQHTLQTLYERRSERQLLTFEAYNAIGGLEGAIAHRAEAVFATLPEAARARLDGVLSRLIVVQPDSDAVSARHTNVDDLDTDARVLVDAFIDARLFVGDLVDGRPTVGVIHEALLRRWPRAVEWTQDNRRLLQARARLQRAAKRWDEGGRRPDHLLNPGQPLAEAQDVAVRFPGQIDEDAMAFLRMSGKASRTRRRIRIAATAALAVLSIASTGFAYEAVQAKQTAERRERESRRLIDYLLGPLAEELRRREMLKLLGSIGKEAIDYLEDRNPATMRQAEMVGTARAYRTVGEALLETKSRREAQASFEQAYRLAAIAIDRDGKDGNAYFERGNAAYWMGKIDYDEKRFDDAESRWRQYLRDSDALARLDPHAPKALQEQGYAHNNLGTLALRRGRLASAMDHFLASTDAKKRLRDMDGSNLDYRFDYIDSRSWIASTLEASGKPAAAAAEYRTQIRDLEALIASDRSASRWRSRLANYKLLSANLEIGMGRPGNAVGLASDAVRILEGLESLSPDNDGLSIDLAKARLILADAHAASMDPQAATVRLRSVIDAVSDLDAEAASSLAWRWIHARARFSLGMLDRGRSPGPETDQAIDDMAALVEENPNDDMREFLAYALLQRGAAHARRGRADLSRRDCDSAVAHIERTAWQGHPFRTWVRSEAKAMAGDAAGAREARQWLSSIGYVRHP